MAERCAPQATLEEIDGDQNAGEKGQRSQSECSAEAATAVGGAGRGDRLGPATPGPGGEQNLQNPENRREIVADDQLRRVFGKDKVTMFEMNKHLAAHLT
jgi:upstream activation factor subunit UAF30